jgi:RimJ/RimL family protein N-acetyltransferase
MDQSFSLQDLYEDRLETPRISTRFLSRFDIEAWSAFFENDEAFQFLMKRDGQTNLELSEKWIKKQLQRYESGTFGLQAIIDRKSKQMVGQCGLLLRKIDGKLEIEVGYHILKKYWGMGYAPEAAKLFVDFALENQLAQNVIAIIHEKNEKSIRVAEKIEMKLDRETEWMGERVKVYKSL